MRAEARQARREVASLRKDIAGLQAQLAAANAKNSGMSKGLPGMSKWGNQLQWAGRQLQYNFTLPIAIAGAAATKFALDNERALVRIKKVYGDAGHNAQTYSKEIDALGRNFEALSEKFGVNQAAVLDVAAGWAAAGSSGVALAKATALTLRTMVLGEMDAVDATQALISIQAQFRQSTDEMSNTIDTLNMIENQTGISLQGLIQGFQRSAGVAASAGIDVQHLGAMLAALVPSSGSAANAGNALKTIISRLLSPTKEASEVMQLMGIHIKDTAWQSLNGTQRLEEFSKAYEKLNGSQKITVASTIASRWQINRFDVLMKDLINTNGYYQKSLKSTNDANANFRQAQSELNQVLDSSPQKLKQIWVILQNVLADVIQPLIPYIIRLGQIIADLAHKFNALPPQVQATVMGLLLFLAAIGPVARYVGSVANLIGILGMAFHQISREIFGVGKIIGKALLSPFKLIIAAASGLFTVIDALATAIVGRLAWAFARVQLMILGSAIPALRAFASAAVATVLPAVAGVASAVGAMLSTLATTSLAMMMPMVRGLMLLWGAMMTQLAVLTAGGLSRVAAVWTVFSRGFMSAVGILVAAVPRMFLFMTVAMSTIFSRLIPLVMASLVGLRKVIFTALIGLTSNIAGILMTLSRVAVAALLSPWGIAIAAALGLIYYFRDQIGQAWVQIIGFFRSAGQGIPRAFEPVVKFFNDAVNYVEKAFWRLPEGVTGALVAVVKIVQTAAMRVYELFSYLNPWAHHSPSLVESVTTGIAAVQKQYAKVSNVGSAFAKAASDLKQFKVLANSLQELEWKDTATQIGKGLPTYLPLFKSLLADMKSLNASLAMQKALVDSQQKIVDKWAASLEAANAALDREQNKLDDLESTLSALNDAYDAHKQALDDFASAPIKGMQQMSDAIFANEMAQKKLQLQMMDWEKVNGSIDDLRNRLASLQGDIETLQGTASDLRSAGAGSDVLGPIEDQIAAMEQQQKALTDTVQNSPIAEMQKELERLRKEGERLDLENSINFDPLLRKIDQLAHAQKELSYDEIVAGINREKAAMAALEPQIAAATKAVDAQKAAVAAAQAARDSIQASYDAEKAKLDKLNDSYRETEQLVNDIESALRNMGSAASDNIQKAKAAADAANGGFGSPGAQNFRAAMGASDFPSVTGTAGIGREGGLGDQSAAIDELTKKLQDDVKKSFGSFDMFKPIKDAWNKAWGWVEKNILDKVNPILEDVQNAMDGFHFDIQNPFEGAADNPIVKNAKQVWDTIVQVVTDTWNGIKRVFELFAPDIRKIWDEIVKAGRRIWTEIGPELAKFSGPLANLGKALKTVWVIIRPIVAIIGGALVVAFKLLASIISHVVGPVFDFLIDIIKSAIKIIRGIVEVVVGVLSGDWKMAWQGIKDIVVGAFDAIIALFKGIGKTLWGLLTGALQGIIDIWNWLVDILVGHSIIPDLIDSIVEFFAGMPKRLWNALKDLTKWVVSRVQEMWDGFKKRSVDMFTAYVNWLVGLPKKVYDNLIALKNRVGDVAKQAWDWFKTTSVTRWGGIASWIGGLPKAAYDKIIAIKTKLGDAAKEGWKKFKDTAVSMFDGKNGILAWFGSIPGKIASALGGLGGVVANSVKSSWNTAADWINKYGLANINKVTSKFGLTVPQLPHFAGGGVIGSGKISKRDDTIIAARSGEGVIVPELVRALGGRAGLKQANDAARSGRLSRLQELGIPAFRDGGVIGDIKDSVTGMISNGAGFALDKIIAPLPAALRKFIPGRPLMEDVTAGSLDMLRKSAREWGDKKEEGGNKKLGGIGWKWQVDVLKKQFPNIIITSTTRPGAITASGNGSYHAIGRAVDMAPHMEYFDWIRANYGKTSKELIYSPAGTRQIKDGHSFLYSGAVKDMHYNHVHWAYDQGGILKPGATMAYNRTGQDELVLTNSDMLVLSSIMDSVGRIMGESGSAGTPGASTVARMSGVMATLDARLRASDARSQDVARPGTNIGTQLNFYGDLVLPNITNGEDAEEFIKNLKALGGDR